MTQLSTASKAAANVLSDSAVHAKAVELGKHVIRMTSAAGSGHASSALSLGQIIVELMYRHMRYDPADPWNPTSDRLVLSIGHAVPIVYAAYADLGGAVGTNRAHARPLTIDDLATLRAFSSVLDGHPSPAECFPFFDAATGSLGQGLSVGAGLALAARRAGIKKRIFVIAGDGESREGQIWEAADFIVDHKLHNVGLITSCNGDGQAGPVSPQQSAKVLAAKAAAFGWHVLEVDGHDPTALAGAIATIGEGDRPTAIVARTVKGWGVDLMIGKNYHGKPLPAGEVEKACAQLDATGEKLGAKQGAPMRPTARSAPPPTATIDEIRLPSFESALKRAGLESALEKKRLATRRAWGVALAALGDVSERIVSLDGDVSNSTFAEIFAKQHPDRFFECKIAEQNMISAAVGLAAGGFIPFASSFAKFIARATDQIDLASITRANIKIVGSHAGVSLAADGPSQMGLADVAYFRSMTRVDDGQGRPLCYVFHPADPIAAYRCTELMARLPGLCYMRTHRPDAPFLYELDEAFEPGGCKQLRSGEHLTLVSSGYMLHTVLEAARQLEDTGVRCNVFDAYSFPLDAGSILTAARERGGAILTVEDNYSGGLHAEIAEAAADRVRVRVSGLTVGRVPKSARTASEVFAHVGVGLDQIMERSIAIVRG